MRRNLVLAIDQGTTGTKVLLIDRNSSVVSQAYREVTQHYPRPGWVEHDPREIWGGVVEAINEVLRQVDADSIEAVGITNQRETTVVWDKETGEPLAPAVVWQCRRSSSICRQLQEASLEESFRNKTGLVIDPYFSGTKLKWLLDNIPGLRKKAEEGRACFGTIDSWLLWNLTGGEVFATDYSNASRTLLFNIHDLGWDEELLEILTVPKAMLPSVCPSSSVFGRTVRIGDLPAGIPICGVIGDSQGALFGEGCFRSGMAKATYGTGTSFMVYVGDDPMMCPRGVVLTLAWGLNGQVGYAFEGVINVTGATMQWLRDGVGIIEDVSKSAEIAAGVKDNEGVYLVPAFVGLSAPYWDTEARGLICGLTRGTTRAHLIRAGLESIAYQVKDVVEFVKEKTGIVTSSLRADGGAAANPFLMQFQADILGVDVLCPRVKEVSALGAAYLAGLQVGLWTGLEDVTSKWSLDQKYISKMDEVERNRLYEGWIAAVKRSLSS